ncbi:MAG: ribonuclease HII [Gammaproteobacteria bacterium]|nr:MAG: ribonuclease HII [Gammaproteobacteria bacterium]
MNDLPQPKIPPEVRFIAGVDEAGRGPLAGPVVAAAVILDPLQPVDGLADSKQLSAKRREELYEVILCRALSWCIARASVEEIDEHNILQATMLAMQRAMAGLTQEPDYALIDGNRCPALDCPSEAVVKGDQRVACISAASILAKVDRDREMLDMDNQYPGYGFASHKGYPTRAHIQALSSLGVTPLHRRTFGPVRKIMTGC